MLQWVDLKEESNYISHANKSEHESSPLKTNNGYMIVKDKIKRNVNVVWN